PLAVIDPSGYSNAAATSRRSGASSAIWSRGGNVGGREWGLLALISSPDGQGAGRYDCWLHRAPRHDRVPGHDRELIDIMFGRSRPIPDHRRDRREKFRRQLDDVLSRTSSDLD